MWVDSAKRFKAVSGDPYPVLSTVTKTAAFTFNTTNIPTGTQIDASGYWGSSGGNFTSLSGTFPTDYYFYFNNTGTVPLTLANSGIGGSGVNVKTIYGGEKWLFVKASSGWTVTNVSKTFQNVSIVTTAGTITAPSTTMLVNVLGSGHAQYIGDGYYGGAGGLASKLLTGLTSGDSYTAQVDAVTGAGGDVSAFRPNGGANILVGNSGGIDSNGSGTGGTTNVTGGYLYLGSTAYGYGELFNAGGGVATPGVIILQWT